VVRRHVSTFNYQRFIDIINKLKDMMFVQAVGQMFNRLGVSKVLMDENL
jgi:predicted flavoprotein YhiN